MRTFIGSRDDGACRIWIAGVPHRPHAESIGGVGAGQPERELPPRPELFRGQCFPFDWGVNGSGTSHVAVALLVEVLGVGGTPTRSLRSAFLLIRRFLSLLPADDFELSESFLLAVVRASGPQMSEPRGLEPHASEVGDGMKIYNGILDADDFFVRVSTAAPQGRPAPEPYLLPGRPDLFRELLPGLAAGPAPSFRWAAPGPGTDHLALAIAVDVAAGAGSGEGAALLLSGLALLGRFLAHLPPDGFEIAETVFVAMLMAAATAGPASAPDGRGQPRPAAAAAKPGGNRAIG